VQTKGRRPHDPVITVISGRDLAWLAGLMEGEGSFFPGPPSSPRMPVIQVAMTDRDVLERAGLLLGRRVLDLPTRKRHWKASYSITIRGARAVAWMQLLHPLVGRRRREQIERALASYEPREVRALRDEDVREIRKKLAAGQTVKGCRPAFRHHQVVHLRPAPRPNLRGRKLNRRYD